MLLLRWLAIVLLFPSTATFTWTTATAVTTESYNKILLRHLLLLLRATSCCAAAATSTTSVIAAVTFTIATTTGAAELLDSGLDLAVSLSTHCDG